MRMPGPHHHVHMLGTIVLNTRSWRLLNLHCPAASQGLCCRKTLNLHCPAASQGLCCRKADISRRRLRGQVGAALSMVYSSGAPIMFVGCGQTYVDLTKLNVKSIVRSLLK